MKKFALAISMIVVGSAGASAADMAVKAPPMAAPVLGYDWSGIYIGLNAGYGWGSNTDPGIAFTDPGPSFLDLRLISHTGAMCSRD